VNLLLDTNAFIRWHAGTLKPTALRAVKQAGVVAVSAVTAWEVATKRALGKLRMEDAVEDVVEHSAFLPLAVTVRHGDLLRDLPLHHADPFDRLLIVQALEEGLTILTADRVFELYRVPVMWV